MTQTNESAAGPGSLYQIAKSFTASASAGVQEPEGAIDAFQYGIVQNVMYDHVYQAFTEGDMLVDSVGPLVDVGTKDEIPFIHASKGNLVFPITLFTTMTAGPSFTDVTSVDVAPKLHCEKSKFVKPLKVERSLAFTAALVAQHVESKQLTQLGGIGTTYHVKWQVDFERDTNGWKSKELYQPDGSYPLSTSAAAVTLDGTIGNDQVQAAMKAESEAFETRCGNVLSQSQPPIGELLGLPPAAGKGAEGPERP